MYIKPVSGNRSGPLAIELTGICYDEGFCLKILRKWFNGNRLKHGSGHHSLDEYTFV